MNLPNELWSAARPSAPGKFLYAGDQKLWVRGVTYGTFRPSADGALFPAPAVVRRDFAQIAAAGFNAVRIPVSWDTHANQRGRLAFQLRAQHDAIT